MKTRIVQKNPKAISKILKSYKNSYEIKVGYPSTTKSISYPNKNIDVVEVAYYNEYGTKNIPARPFMQKSIEPSIQASNKIVEQGITAVNNGSITEKKLMKLVGEAVTAVHKKVITDLKEPPNAVSTIKRKKSSNPLIDTALMRNSLTYVVTER